MKLIIERVAGNPGACANVVERRNTIHFVQRKTRRQGWPVHLNATDMDLDIVDAAGMPEPGVTTAPAHMLYEIVKLPDGATSN
jgi:DNA polymerase-3 subunit beta